MLKNKTENTLLAYNLTKNTHLRLKINLKSLKLGLNRPNLVKNKYNLMGVHREINPRIAQKLPNILKNRTKFTTFSPKIASNCLKSLKNRDFSTCMHHELRFILTINPQKLPDFPENMRKMD